MKCNTYAVMSGEPHLGRVRECEYTIDGDELKEAIIERLMADGYLWKNETFEQQGFEYKLHELLSDEQIGELNENPENADEIIGDLGTWTEIGQEYLP